MMGILPDEWWHLTLLRFLAFSAASIVLIIATVAFVTCLLWG